MKMKNKGKAHMGRGGKILDKAGSALKGFDLASARHGPKQDEKTGSAKEAH